MKSKQLDELTVTIVVDNETDTLSSIEPGVPQTPELAGHVARATSHATATAPARIEAFGPLCLACHGFSALLTGRIGDETHTVLVDAGPDGEVWLTNAQRLGIDLSQIEAIFLSHWHYDHSGALPTAISAVAAARHATGLAPPIVDVHPDRPEQRGAEAIPGMLVTLPSEPSLGSLADAGGHVEASSEPHLLGEGFFYVSGEIARRSDFETGLPGHQTIRDGAATADPLIMDERLIAAEVRGRGVTVISPCSHAGIVNAANAASDSFDGAQIDLVLGGFHLGGRALEDRIAPTVEHLDALGVQLVAAGHCTGWRAKAALTERLGPQRFAACVVGSTFTLAAG